MMQGPLEPGTTVLTRFHVARRSLFAAALLALSSLAALSGPSAASPAPAPVLTALSATSGVPGQTITVSGSGFYSAHGLIVANFSGHPATTVCPTRQRCLVTVPTRAGLLGVYQLRVQTETGTSNALGFRVLRAAPAPRPRCSLDPTVAAEFIIPPPPFSVRNVVVRLTAMPPSEPAGGGPGLKRLYAVTFSVLKGNAVLPAGHSYTQFAYVGRSSTSVPWCFTKGGSGP